MKPSHTQTPRLLRHAYLEGIGYSSEKASPALFFAGLILGIVFGSLI